MPRAKKVTDRRFRGKPIVGEEGVVGFLPEPLQLTGTDVVKTFHTNYYPVTSKRECGEPTTIKYPRFLYSQASAGFMRLYHIYRLAHTLFPENVIDMRGALVPDNMPLYFDEYHPPTMRDGSVQYPEFTSHRIPADRTQERRIRGLYKAIAAKHDEVHTLYGEKGRQADLINEVILTDKFGKALEKLERYEEWIVERSLKLGVNPMESELKLMEAGIMQPHSSVNMLLVPGRGDTQPGVVFCEVDAYMDEGRVEKAIESLDDPKAAKAAAHHLQQARDYETRAFLELARKPAELAKNKTIMNSQERVFQDKLRKLGGMS